MVEDGVVGIEQITALGVYALYQLILAQIFRPKRGRGIAGKHLFPVVARVSAGHFAVGNEKDGVILIRVGDVLHGDSLHFQRLIEFGEILGLVHPVPLLRRPQFEERRHAERECAVLLGDERWAVFAPPILLGDVEAEVLLLAQSYFQLGAMGLQFVPFAIELVPLLFARMHLQVIHIGHVEVARGVRPGQVFIGAVENADTSVEE